MPTISEQKEAIEDVAESMTEQIHYYDIIGGAFGVMAELRNKKTKELQKVLDKTVQNWRMEQLESIGVE